MRQASLFVVTAMLIGCTTSDMCMRYTPTIGTAFASLAAADAAGQAAPEAINATPDKDAPHAPPGRWSAGGSLGFTIDPSAFLAGFEGDYAVTDNVRVGPLLQLVVSDDDLIVAPSANVKYLIDLPEGPEPLARLKPFAQMGVGFAYIEKERRGQKDEDDLGFLLNMGFGFQYDLTDYFAVGNNVLFNVMPTKVLDERFFFSWQFLTATVRF